MTDDRQTTDHATEKWVGIGEIGCARVTPPSEMSTHSLVTSSGTGLRSCVRLGVESVQLAGITSSLLPHVVCTSSALGNGVVVVVIVSVGPPLTLGCSSTPGGALAPRTGASHSAPCAATAAAAAMPASASSRTLDAVPLETVVSVGELTTNCGYKKYVYK